MQLARCERAREFPTPGRSLMYNAPVTAVGKDIESLCGKCGPTWHVVVAMVGTQIAKIQCKECGGYHRYRSETRRSPGAPVRRRTQPRRPAAAVVAPDPKRELRPYSPAEVFGAGDQVTHRTFGVGVVQSSNSGRMTVAFPCGDKVLACAKPAAALQRPLPLGES